MPAEIGAARAFWIVAPGRGEIRPEILPARGRDEVLVRALASGISRGTESLVFQGRIPPSQYAVMRCPFQAGALPFPVKYGYASVGVVEAGPADLVGRRVFALHPHQDRYLLPQDAVIAIPDAVPTERAVLAANMETALNGIWDASPRPGDRVSVIGAGVVGCLVAALAAGMPGTEVELIDLDPTRATLAAALGTGFATPGSASREADLVVHASGNPSGLVLALSLAGFEATVLELSWYGDKPVSVPLGEAFHSRRLVLKSSQVGAVATAQRARWSYRRRLGLALKLLENPVFDALLTGASPLDDLPATMARLAAAPAGALCHRVTYS
jgi:threonine dehydrogenase-like Zn-dependent dehydrogenase